MASKVTTKSQGDEAEDRALAYLQTQGLVLVERNYRVAKGPSARGAEVDLIMRATDGTLVFVEVRSRTDRDFGGAAASISRTKPSGKAPRLEVALYEYGKSSLNAKEPNQAAKVHSRRPNVFDVDPPLATVPI